MVITAQDTIQKPGYKQTGVGEIPKDWEVCSLDDVVTKVGSGITPTGGEKVYKKEGRPFLRSQNVGWGHLLFDDIAFIDEETHRSFLATEIKLDDVLLNITGASIGRSAVADNRLLGGNVNQHVCIIRTDASKLNPYYLNFFLLSGSGQKQIESFQAGGNRQGLNFGQIRSFQIPLPPLSEQQVIATALSEVDALIASLDRLIAKKRDIKQATMQQLLTGKVRLPEFSRELKSAYKQTEVGMIPSDWEPTPLGLISAFITKGATPTTYGFNWLDDGVLFLRSECVSEQGLDLTQSMFITPEAHNTLKRGEVRAGDILITITGNVGRVIYLSNDFGIANINQHIARIRIIDNNVAADYVFHFLSQPMIRKYYSSIITGQAYPQISLIQVRDTRIPIPPTKAEQQAIATILSDMDTEIAALEQKRDKTRALKQGMMQELLTGRTRLL